MNVGLFPVVRETLVSKDRFNILVRTGKRTSKHSTTRGVGIGSKEQDFLLDLALKHHTSGSHPGIYSVGMRT